MHALIRCAAMLPTHAGVAAEGSLPEREFSYYPRLTAMSTMYPDEADAAQVSSRLATAVGRDACCGLLELLMSTLMWMSQQSASACATQVEHTQCSNLSSRRAPANLSAVSLVQKWGQSGSGNVM
jgi:hypothetical protein